MKNAILPVLLSCSTLFITSARAEDDLDKGQYCLFHPTPRSEMRDWRTDQAGMSPYTTDAGHFELDVTAVSYAYLKLPLAPFGPGTPIESTPIESWAFGAFVAKAGLLNSLDLEVGYLPYRRTTGTMGVVVPGGGSTFTEEGSGDTSVGMKWNLWGNDGGKTALSLSGVVTFPTATGDFKHNDYTGGPSLEFAAQIPWGFELRIDSQAILLEDGVHNMQAVLPNLISLSHPIVGNLNGYAMFMAQAYTANVDWVGFVKTGLTYRLCRDVELFAGSWFGVHGSAPDYNPFAGISARF